MSNTVQINWADMQDALSATPTETVVIFNYGREFEFSQFYLMGQDEAVERFTEQMNNRSEFEIADEGWTVNGIVVQFLDGQAHIGAWGAQMKRLQDMLFTQ